ncbi:type I restriction enzyme HsdR N-terminal domain-containing protein [Methylophilaceae bacterium]|nr:type I restriction enzyme HsdR N-terminal domain-containing protein [Methylophilaceae bacterium]
MSLPRFKQTFKKNYPKYKRLLIKAKDKDINEADTVDIITGILNDILGYDRYRDITREYLIKGTYCDLALKINDKLKILIEVKAIGVELKDTHLTQAVGYGATEGIEWIILTNGLCWKCYKITWKNKVESHLVYELDFGNISFRKDDDSIAVYGISKDGFKKNIVQTHYQYQQLVNKYNVGSVLLSDFIARQIRTQLKKVNPKIKIDVQIIKAILENEIIKREIVDNDLTKLFTKKIKKFLK